MVGERGCWRGWRSMTKRKQKRRETQRPAAGGLGDAKELGSDWQWFPAPHPPPPGGQFHRFHWESFWGGGGDPIPPPRARRQHWNSAPSFFHAVRFLEYYCGGTMLRIIIGRHGNQASPFGESFLFLRFGCCEPPPSDMVAVNPPSRYSTQPSSCFF